nr:hypothetical protein [Candidatus Halobonum tyrrellensis]
MRHYDIQFTFDVRKSQSDFRASQKPLISDGGDELFEAEEYRRVLLTDELVDRFATDAGFSLADRREAVFEADDIDDASAPVAWGECQGYSRTDDAAMVMGGTAAAATASVGAASCAGAGAAAGGGGAC